jgi:hypothetical protein
MDGSKGLFGILKGYTSISRMQIYTDDYFSVLNMMVPTLKFVDSSILSQIVHGPRSVWITSIHAERYRIIAFVHAYMNTCAYVVPPALDDDVTFDLASSASIKCTSFVLQVVMQDQHSYHYSPAFARTFHRFAWTRTQRRVPTTSPSGRDDLG